MKMSDINIQNLPTEAFIEILSKIDGITLGICRGVCKKWMECIDEFDQVWEIMCEKEFKHPSRIAKKKAGSDIKWQNIYKNMVMWTKGSKFQPNVREFYQFNTNDKNHALEINSNILPLRDTRGIVLYEINTLKYIPVVVPERNCIKIDNNNNVTAILIKSGLLVQRSVESERCMSEAFFEADNFILTDNTLFFYKNNQVLRCDLLAGNLYSSSIYTCHYDIKEMNSNHTGSKLHLFTACGRIVTISSSRKVTEKTMNIPVEWIRQIKHICPIDENNYICYSRYLFKIETDKYEHLYLDFPLITALFFYGDFVVIGTRAGEILLYRLSSQNAANKPIFENLAALPDGKFATYLDIAERKTGPIIVAATFFNIYLFEIEFFPQEHLDQTKWNFPPQKALMYKRLQRLKDRLQLN